MYESPWEGNIEYILHMKWGQVGMGTGGTRLGRKEQRKGILNELNRIGGTWQQSGNLVQYKLSGIYEGDPSKDS